MAYNIELLTQNNGNFGNLFHLKHIVHINYLIKAKLPALWQKYKNENKNYFKHNVNVNFAAYILKKHNMSMCD